MFSRIYRFLSIFIFIFTHSSYSQDVPEISPVQVKQLLDEKENIILIDVRTSDEFTGGLGHIPGALLRPLQEIEEWHAEFSEKKENRIVMVCRSGNRSRVATKYFQDRDYENIKNMSGGMRAWNKLSFPTEKSPAEK